MGTLAPEFNVPDMSDLRDAGWDELAAMSPTSTTFEDLATVPETTTPIEDIPVMTNMTWDHATKQRDYSDSGGGGVI